MCAHGPRAAGGPAGAGRAATHGRPGAQHTSHQLARRARRAWRALPSGRWQNIRSRWLRSPSNPEGGLSSHQLYQIKRKNKTKQKPCGEGGGMPHRPRRLLGLCGPCQGRATSLSQGHRQRGSGGLLPRPSLNIEDVASHPHPCSDGGPGPSKGWGAGRQPQRPCESRMASLLPTF